MAVVGWDPFEELLALGERMDRFLGLSSGRLSQGWMPAMDIFDSRDRLTMRLDLPGIKPEDVDLAVEGSVLTVSGERHQDEASTAAGSARVERRFGRFERRIPLPQSAKVDQIEASYRDGVLQITVPKAEAELPRRIEVRQAGLSRVIGAPEGAQERPAHEPEVMGGEDLPPEVPPGDLGYEDAEQMTGAIVSDDERQAQSIGQSTHRSSIDTDDESGFDCATRGDTCGATAGWTAGAQGGQQGEQARAQPDGGQVGGESSLEEMIQDIMRANAESGSAESQSGSPGSGETQSGSPSEGEAGGGPGRQAA